MRHPNFNKMISLRESSPDYRKWKQLRQDVNDATNTKAVIVNFLERRERDWEDKYGPIPSVSHSNGVKSLTGSPDLGAIVDSYADSSVLPLA